jgi:hypothetical protein
MDDAWLNLLESYLDAVDFGAARKNGFYNNLNFKLSFVIGDSWGHAIMGRSPYMHVRLM